MVKENFILFDFDGVIADSFKVAFETAQTRCPAITEIDYRKRFDENINEVKHSETFHNDECNHDLDWFDIYIPKLRDEVDIFPGIKEVILKLEEKYILVIVSSTLTFPIEEFLVLHELQNHFDWVMGNDVHKSKTEKIRMVFEKYGVSNNDCVFVTDTLGDIHEAKKLDVSSIGVTWGFSEAGTLEKGNPFRLVNTPQELTDAVVDYFQDKF